MDTKDIKVHDAKILELAKYDASRGGLVVPTRKDIGFRFREFKSLIMRKEISLDELDALVRSRHGDPNRKPVTSEDLGIKWDCSLEELKLMPPSEVCVEQFNEKSVDTDLNR